MKCPILKIFFACIIGLFLISCQNDEVDVILNENPDVSNESLKYEFIYKGVGYSSTYNYTKDSVMVFDDSNCQEVWQTMIANPQLAMLVGDNGAVEYFDNSEEARKNAEMKSEISLSNATKGIGTSVMITSVGLILYEDTGFKGREHWMRIDSNYPRYMYPTLRNCNLNDKVSAVKLYIDSWVEIPASSGFRYLGPNNIATLYEHGDYVGWSITFRVDANRNPWDNHFESSLKRWAYPGGGDWNDRISSVILGY